MRLCSQVLTPRQNRKFGFVASYSLNDDVLVFQTKLDIPHMMNIFCWIPLFVKLVEYITIISQSPVNNCFTFDNWSQEVLDHYPQNRWRLWMVLSFTFEIHINANLNDGNSIQFLLLSGKFITHLLKPRIKSLRVNQKA